MTQMWVAPLQQQLYAIEDRSPSCLWLLCGSVSNRHALQVLIDPWTAWQYS